MMSKKAAMAPTMAWRTLAIPLDDGHQAGSDGVANAFDLVQLVFGLEGGWKWDLTQDTTAPIFNVFVLREVCVYVLCWFDGLLKRLWS